MAEPTVHVKSGERGLAGQTLAVAVRSLAGGPGGGPVSWSAAETVVANRRVTVNGNVCLDAARRLREGDVIRLHAHARAAPPSDDDVAVRHLDAHLVVV